MTLVEYNTRYETLIHSDLTPQQKDLKLANLMSEMEVAFNIPMIRKPEWEEENRAVIAMYRKISMSRTF